MKPAQHLIVDVQDMVVSIPCLNTLEIASFDRVTTTDLPNLRAPVSTTMMHDGCVVPVIDARLLFNLPTFEDQLAKLRDTLNAREADHVQWLNALRESCTTGSPFTKATDPHQCAFGRWYDALTASDEAMEDVCRGDRSLRHIVSQFDAPHRAIHGIAARALQLATSGDLDAAHELVEQSWNTDLARMRELFAALIAGVEASRKSLYIVVHAGDHVLALLVDAARLIVNVDEDAIQPIPLSTGSLRGVLPVDNIGETLVLDLERVASHCLEAPKFAAT